MKKLRNGFAVFVVFALVGCATTAVDRQDKTTRSFEDTKNQMQDLRAQLDKTLYSLNSLMSAPPGEIKNASTLYANDLRGLHDESDRLKANAKSMREQRIDYLTEWERAQLNIDDPALKRVAEQRQREMSQRFATISKAYQDADKELDPLLQHLDDVGRIVTNDPTPAGINAIKRTYAINAASRQANRVNRRLDGAIVEFDRLIASLSPVPGKPQPATAVTRRPSPTPTASTPAVAQQAPSFREADKNSNSAIDPEEAQQVPGLDFAQSDSNRDGKLSQSEYETALKAIKSNQKADQAPQSNGAVGSSNR